VRFEDDGAARCLRAGVNALIGGPVLCLCRQQLNLRIQQQRQEENGSTHLTSAALHVVQIVPEVWDDPIGK
jgi:hypothetical protein